MLFLDNNKIYVKLPFVDSFKSDTTVDGYKLTEIISNKAVFKSFSNEKGCFNSIFLLDDEDGIAYAKYIHVTLTMKSGLEINLFNLRDASISSDELGFANGFDIKATKDSNYKNVKMKSPHIISHKVFELIEDTPYRNNELVIRKETNKKRSESTNSFVF